MMKRKAAVYVFSAAPVVLTAALTASCAHAAAGGALEKAVSSVGFGVTEKTYDLAKKPTGKEFRIRERTVFIGSGEGTRFFTVRRTTGLENDGAVHVFRTAMHAQEYGAVVSARLAALKRHSFAFSYSRREVHTDKYIDFSKLCGCIAGKIGVPEVHSNPSRLTWSYAPSDEWTVSLSRGRANVVRYEYETGDTYSLLTKTHALRLKREGGKADFELSLARYSPKKPPYQSIQPPENTNVEFSAAYKPFRNLKVSLVLGMFTDGVPTAGGAFSELGEALAIPYITGDTELAPLFSEKFGYWSVGIGYVLTMR
ncbi:MAG: hypothetical protein AB1742_11395 [bacterium]